MKMRFTLVAAALLWTAPLPAPASPPKLVVAIVVDQLRYDYLERFEEQFCKGGFRLLMEEGAFLTFAHYDYAPTVTGPGHASILSGAPPSVHGIIGNDWFDKRTGKILNCVADPDVEGVGASGNGGRRSPRHFIGSNLADEMRLRFRSKVVGLSLKDRGAILPAGKKPAGAYWFDSLSGSFITSTHYAPELPKWVSDFNSRKLPSSFIGETWKRLLPESAYQWADQLPGEGATAGDRSKTFDHTIRSSAAEGFENIVPTPFGNQLLVEFAQAAIDGEQLGRGPNPDLLCISFSSPDAAGHIFGPYSQEVQDIALRLDQQLETLFARLDRKFGLSNVTIVLTADHGVAPAPEFATAQGLDGRRVDTTTLMGDLFATLEARFGAGKFLLSRQMHDGQLYFDHRALRERGIEPNTLGAAIRDWALDTGCFQAAFTKEQLLDGRAPGALGQLVLNGFHAERGGDVVLVKKPFQLGGTAPVGTTHGSPYSYDTHVPVLFYGAGFKPGRYAEKFSITDVAPTLSAALRLSPPSGNTGKPLTKILTGK
jgi:predicted AlkP superfamily pyrophosphatase or phosphodiesterase